MSKILYERRNPYAQKVWKYSAPNNVFMWAYHALHSDLSNDPTKLKLESLDSDHQCEYANNYVVWSASDKIIEEASCEHCHSINPDWFESCAIRLRLVNK